MARRQTLQGISAILLVLLIAAPLSRSQTRTDGSYPPGQYPPGPYPPGQYPPNSVPMRLPGGIPVGVEVPQIKLPRRAPKSGKPAEKTGPDTGRDDLKMTLCGVDGTLRELGEKDLFLEKAGSRLLRFRLLAKTQFRDKEGEPVRDSLLKPGDQLSLHVNQDDPETALRVILSRAGTQAERAAATKPFDRASAQVPAEADTHPVGSIEVAGEGDASPGEVTSGTSAPDFDPGRPKLQRKSGGASTGSEPGRETAAQPPPGPEDEDRGDPSRPSFPPDDDIIAAARTAAQAFTEETPNFIVQQLTTRYFSDSIPAQWRALDVVSAEVACVGGREEYRNILVNGKPARAAIEKTGTWSTGEFVTTLQDILAPLTAAAFLKRGEDRLAGRTAYMYDFSIRRPTSHWRIVAPDGRWDKPAYTGTIWIDKEFRRVLRIEQRTGLLPGDFPYDKAESTIDYDFVRIDTGSYLLPVRSEALACLRGTADCTRNEISFRNYRKFTTDTKITFEKFRAPDY